MMSAHPAKFRFYSLLYNASLTLRRCAQNAAYAAAPAGAAAAAAVRLAQAQRLLCWLDAALASDKAAPPSRRCCAVLLAGGLNAPPGEAAHAALRDWGLRGVSPPPASDDPAAPATPTWPTPLKARMN